MDEYNNSLDNIDINDNSLNENLEDCQTLENFIYYHTNTIIDLYYDIKDDLNLSPSFLYHFKSTDLMNIIILLIFEEKYDPLYTKNYNSFYQKYYDKFLQEYDSDIDNCLYKVNSFLQSFKTSIHKSIWSKVCFNFSEKNDPIYIKVSRT